jgi:hypothetical protein
VTQLPQPEDEHDRAILGHIAEHGWSVIGIEEEDGEPPYSFSVGLYHTLGVPELLIVGQKPENAQGLINNAGELMRAGRRFRTNRRTTGILEGYPAVFVAVDPRYYLGYLGCGRWLYRGDEFPILQLVWPDREGRFPWDEGYPAPLFARQRVLGKTKRWPHGWPFPDPPNVATFTTKQVVREKQPILLVTHDDDGNWQFHTGRPASLDDAMVVGLEQMLRLDPSLADLGNLKCGQRATRTSPDAEWEVEGEE